MDNRLDERDSLLLCVRIEARDKLEGPRIGDYVLFPSGELERFSHDWGDGLQTSPGGSFYLGVRGFADFSGGLNPTTPRDELELTAATLPGSFWFFHHDVAGAGRGVYFKIPCRVFKTSAKYGGFLGESFRSEATEALKAELLGVIL